MLAQAKKSLQADPVVRPSSRDKPSLMPTTPSTPSTQPITVQSSSRDRRPDSSSVQQPQTQPLRTEPDSPKLQPSQPSKVRRQPSDLQAQPRSELPAQSPTVQVTPSRPPVAPSTNILGDPSPTLRTRQVTSNVFSVPSPTSSIPRTSGIFSDLPPALPIPQTNRTYPQTTSTHPQNPRRSAFSPSENSRERERAYASARESGAKDRSG